MIDFDKCKGVQMVIAFNVATRTERARAVLFGGASLDAFVPAFKFGGVEYFKQIKTK